MIDDCQIRHLIAKAVPAIDPAKLEVCMVDYDAAVAYLYRDGQRILQGRAPAIQRTEAEIASVLAVDLTTHLIESVMAEAPSLSPYEGKGGRHPRTCTCSKHLKA